MEIVIATFNNKKFQELKRILNSALPEIKFLNLNQFPAVRPVAEVGKSFEENASLKAQGYFQQIGKSVLAEDSGLEVDALNGMPGIYSSHFAGEHGNDYLNNQKLLKLMEGVPEDKRLACFVSVVVIADKQGLHIFCGKLKGKISFTMRGQYGFGYDPVFIPEGFDKTLAELGPEVKDKISHRYQALQKAISYLIKY